MCRAHTTLRFRVGMIDHLCKELKTPAPAREHDTEHECLSIHTAVEAEGVVRKLNQHSSCNKLPLGAVLSTVLSTLIFRLCLQRSENSFESLVNKYCMIQSFS